MYVIKESVKSQARDTVGGRVVWVFSWDYKAAVYFQGQSQKCEHKLPNQSAENVAD